MLNDKHIEQWAGYLIEEFSNRKELEKILREYPEIDKVFVAMYKKGYEDCEYDNNQTRTDS